ncbi:ABC transporter permease [Thiohalorhabdus sp. Cl-TMA]|uniref:ABC transporter permease n=1 Tax=Thiohalorhabdus methylotrophus TaxID=3242694 RepID=A0ABV4TSE5_9GAMM
MASLNRIWGLIVKELLALLKDPRARVVLIAPPLVQLLVFGYAATFDVNDVRVGVLNRDGGELSRRLVAGFSGAPAFHVTRHLDQIRQARPLLGDKKVDMVLHIGPDFGAHLHRGRAARAQVLVDGRNSNTAAIISQYAGSIVAAFNREALGNGGDAELAIRAWFNPNLVSRWFIVPGLVGVLTLVVTTLVTALSVAREREAGTFNQLLVTPLRPPEILLGKALPAIFIGLAEASVIVAFAVFWFGVPLAGDLRLLYLGLLLFMLSTVGMGLLISSLCATQQQALLGAFLYIVPAIILSGFATPIANMPETVQDLTLLDPLRYCLVVVRGVFLKDLPLELLLPQLWPMALIGLVTLSAAGALFRSRLG